MSQTPLQWRTLPFLAATLALQLAGLAQVRYWIGGVGRWLYWLSLVLLAAAALATFAALLFLAESIWPARFRYVTREPDLQDYLEKVRAGEVAGAARAMTRRWRRSGRREPSWCSDTRWPPRTTRC